MKKIHFSRLLRLLLLASLALLCIVSIDAFLYEPFHPQVTYHSIELSKLPQSLDGLRIVHLSDLHYGQTIKDGYLQRVVCTVNALHPDIVVITGDMVPGYGVRTNPLSPKATARRITIERANRCGRIMGGLRANYGVYAVPGNHDERTMAADAVTNGFRAAKIVMLNNENVLLSIHGQHLWLAGTRSALAQNADFGKALAKVNPEEPVILLAHEPDVADRVANEYPFVDLQLSGHSHGGQVRLFGAEPVLPTLGRKYPMGLYQVGQMALYTTRGIGLVQPPMRLFCLPEISVLTLKSRTAPHPVRSEPR